MSALPGIGKSGLFGAGGGFEGVVTAGPMTFDQNNTNANRNLRIIIAASAISTSGTQVRITVSASTAASLDVTESFIGEQAAAGDTYDFASTPTRITWDGGSNGFTGLASSGEKTSDIVDFVLDETKTYIVSIHCGTNGGCRRDATPLAGWSAVFKDGASDASTVNATGYASIGQDCLKQIEV